MSLFLRIAIRGFSILSLCTMIYAEAVHCPKCEKIERQRAEQQARLGPQAIHYYEDDFQDQISVVSTENRSLLGSEMQDTSQSTSTQNAIPQQGSGTQSLDNIGIIEGSRATQSVMN